MSGDAAYQSPRKTSRHRSMVVRPAKRSASPPGANRKLSAGTPCKPDAPPGSLGLCASSIRRIPRRRARLSGRRFRGCPAGPVPRSPRYDARDRLEPTAVRSAGRSKTDRRDVPDAFGCRRGSLGSTPRQLGRRRWSAARTAARADRPPPGASALGEPRVVTAFFVFRDAAGGRCRPITEGEMNTAFTRRR
jgi:hypothetical protein